MASPHERSKPLSCGDGGRELTQIHTSPLMVLLQALKDNPEVALAQSAAGRQIDEANREMDRCLAEFERMMGEH